MLLGVLLKRQHQSTDLHCRGGARSLSFTGTMWRPFLKVSAWKVTKLCFEREGTHRNLAAELVSGINTLHIALGFKAKIEDGGDLHSPAKAKYCLIGLESLQRGPQKSLCEAVKVKLPL